MSIAQNQLRVEKAIQKGVWLINMPALALFIGGMILCITQLDFLEFYVCVPLGFGLGFLVAWLYWSIAIVKWKLWVYPQVDDIIALKEQAIAANLIWPDDSFFKRTEMMTALQRAELADIEQKAIEKLEKYGIQDDASIGETTTVYHSKLGIYLGLIFGVFFIAIGAYVWYDDSWATGKGVLLKYVAIPMSIYMLYKSAKKFIKRNQPVLVFSETGLYVHVDQKNYLLWPSVWKFEITRKNKTDYLEIGGDGHHFVIEADLSESAQQLSYLYRIYRARHKRNFPQLYVGENNGETIEED